MVEKYKLAPKECMARGEHVYDYDMFASLRIGDGVATKEHPDIFICKYCGHKQIRYYVEHREDKENG